MALQVCKTAAAGFFSVIIRRECWPGLHLESVQSRTKARPRTTVSVAEARPWECGLETRTQFISVAQQQGDDTFLARFSCLLHTTSFLRCPSHSSSSPTPGSGSGRTQADPVPQSRLGLEHGHPADATQFTGRPTLEQCKIPRGRKNPQQQKKSEARRMSDG